MKVLWVCNVMLPVVAEHLNKEVSNKEGWLVGLSTTILERGRDNKVELAVAFPVEKTLENYKEIISIPEMDATLCCYGFYENTDNPENYDVSIEERMETILADYNPDVVHCFGTEYPHALALSRVCDTNKLLLGIQGLCKVCADTYYADLPERVINRVTFRDYLKKDSIKNQKEKFAARGKMEEEAIRNAKHVTGRTEFDSHYTKLWNPSVTYHFMNETLRKNFYEGAWCPEGCELHSIFFSQGDYPLKGLHYVLRALPEICQSYPDTKLYVAGNSIVSRESLKDKIKISSYGKYLLELIKKNNLSDKVVFLGKLSAFEMKAAFLKSHLFLSASTLENSPNSLGEAMLLGVPCVSSKVGGVPSVFAEGEDGILYPGYGSELYNQENDKEKAQAHSLASAVIKMWSKEEELLSFSASARAHAKETHNQEKNYQRLIEIYHIIAEA